MARSPSPKSPSSQSPAPKSRAPKTASRKPAVPAKAGTTLTRENLQALGAERLASFLMELAEHDAALGRTLRMALTAAHARDRLGKEVEKRLRAIQRSRGFLSWDKLKPLAAELDALRHTILEDVAAADIETAARTMRLLVELAPSIHERSDDNGYLSNVFCDAASDLGRLWGRLPNRKPADVVEDILTLLDSDEYGTCDDLLSSCRAALGTDGAALLRATLMKRLQALPLPRDGEDYRAIGARFRITRRLQDLADAMDDVAAYIEAVGLGTHPDRFIGDVARRLLDKGRAREALEWLAREPAEAVRFDGASDDLRIEAHEAAGERDTAQALRLKIFHTRLSLPHWRAYQRHLGDYDAIDAEEQALAHIIDFPDRAAALAALLEWPALDEAARLVRTHADTLDGRNYATLRPAAERLSEAHPNEATRLYRRLVEAVLDQALSRSYSYAAKDLKACHALAPMMTDAPGLETHEAFMTHLKTRHRRKLGFWSLVS
ncbi:DUF6880 family protein [Nguyenibacter sp. L1]|uniref:DUF6880 family protein n=1 Tax=Nguyenibacter sp. L1 TaxID=3049350 RepID=UPI002B46EF2A|nr:DUF6880 family protein [Nguyenibacter sp. L1]WRH87607.1 hypothetical protein QN315_16825 [Nguyenibacter sp. L1]